MTERSGKQHELKKGADQNKEEGKRNQPSKVPVNSRQQKSRLPQWMLEDKMSCCEKFELRIFKIISVFPVFVTFGLYLYIFTFFTVFYVYPTYAGNFPTFIGISNLWTTDEEWQEAITRVSILLGFFLFFAIMLGASILRTIFTNPGSIPEEKEWDMNSDANAETSDEEGNLEIQEDKKYQPLINDAIEEDFQEPKDLSHLDYKYLKSYEGPLAKSPSKDDDEDIENEKLIKGGLKKAKNPISFERKKYGGVRMCQRCLRTKPDRCHHCSQCNKCVLKMDHHCPWVANCIGFNNYKYFINMLFYTSCTNWVIMISTATFMQKVLKATDVSYMMGYYLMTSYILSFTLGIVITGFFCFHLWLITKSFTTIEFCEKSQDGDLNFKTSPYNLGFYRNFQSVLGNNALFWFVPIESKLNGDGIIFEIRDDLKQTITK